MKPKVFVSSTILDFEDLRSALKYYLEEYGYDVQMSEYPNFIVDKDSSAIDTCMKNINNCQYYILLVGYRRGSWYKENEISVTCKEFQTAKELIEKGYPLRIIAFVRKPIWLLKNDRTAIIAHFKGKSDEYSEIIKHTGSSVIDDPNYIFDFLKEISNGINFPSGVSEANNWIIDFNNFKDIIDALKTSLNITGSLHEKKLRRMLHEELERNKLRFLISSDETNMAEIIARKLKIKEDNILEYLAKIFIPKLFDKYGNLLFLEKGILLDKIEANAFHFVYTTILTMIGIKNLEIRFVEKAINEGLFWEFDVKNDDWGINPVGNALFKLLEWINVFKNNFNSELNNNFSKEWAKIATNGSLHNSFVQISEYGCTFILGLVYGIRIFDLSETLLHVINKNDLTLFSNYDYSQKFYLKYL